MEENIDTEHETCVGRKERKKKGHRKEKRREGETLSRDREIHCDLWKDKGGKLG